MFTDINISKDFSHSVNSNKQHYLYFPHAIFILTTLFQKQLTLVSSKQPLFATEIGKQLVPFIITKTAYL